MQVLKNGEIYPKMNDSELWKEIFPQIKKMIGKLWNNILIKNRIIL